MAYKWFLSLVVFGMVFGLVACSGSEASSTEGAATVDSTATTTTAPVVIESAPVDSAATE